jgi:hypothetical protein
MWGWPETLLLIKPLLNSVAATGFRNLQSFEQGIAGSRASGRSPSGGQRPSRGWRYIEASPNDRNQTVTQFAISSAGSGRRAAWRPALLSSSVKTRI